MLSASILAPTAFAVPVPVPGDAPVPVDRVRLGNPSVLAMTGTWRFKLEQGISPAVNGELPADALDDLREKLPLRHLGDVKLGVAAHVFNADRHFQVIADLADLLSRSLRSGEGVGHRKKVVAERPVDAAPAQVVREPRRPGPLDERLQLAQMGAIGPVGRAKVHRDAVLDDAVLLENPVQDLERLAPIHHEILGNDLEPVDDRFSIENVAVMRHPQADADPVIVESVEAVCRHG